MNVFIFVIFPRKPSICFPYRKILEGFKEAIYYLIKEEKRNRDNIILEKSIYLKDKVYRAYGILTYAKMIGEGLFQITDKQYQVSRNNRINELTLNLKEQEIEEIENSIPRETPKLDYKLFN